MEITRIDLPVSTDLRMKNAGTKDSPMWVVAGPNADIAEAIKAGGVHVMTFRGPRVVLVDRVVRLADGLAIVPIDVDFSATTTTAPVEDLTADQLRAALAKLESDKGSTTSTAKVTSSGRGRKPAASKTTANKPAATTTKSAPAAAAVADVDAAELDSLLV